jgi:hypothetical protein
VNLIHHNTRSTILTGYTNSPCHRFAKAFTNAKPHSNFWNRTKVTNGPQNVPITYTGKSCHWRGFPYKHSHSHLHLTPKSTHNTVPPI